MPTQAVRLFPDSGSPVTSTSPPASAAALMRLSSRASPSRAT
ncbi:hypothetical protein ACFVDN_28590 [Streptomyces californicus]